MLKTMVYSKITAYNSNNTDLFTGHVDGYKVGIMNMCGIHPCAYIEIPYEIVSFVDAFLKVHGGITYHDSYYKSERTYYAKRGYIWIGWNYGHMGDYLPPLMSRDCTELNSYRISGHKWTTSEVYEDAIAAIKQIKYIIKEYNTYKIMISNEEKKKYDYNFIKYMNSRKED